MTQFGRAPHLQPAPGWLTAQGPLLAAVLLGVLLSFVLPRVQYKVGLQPPTTSPSAAQVEATVRSYLNDWHPMADPLVTLNSGIQVKSSNLHGVEIGGVRYYYRPAHGFSADPVTRGEAVRHEVVMVLDAGTQWETQVYRLLP